jgi:hypothetical protein
MNILAGRYILDNIITIWEAMEWYHSSGLDALFRNIDFDAEGPLRAELSGLFFWPCQRP